MKILVLMKRFGTNKDLVMQNFGRQIRLFEQIKKFGHDVDFLCADFKKFESRKVENDNIVKQEDVGKEMRVILLDAKRWDYSLNGVSLTNGDGEIRLKKWENVKIKVNNIDTLHWIAIPDMKLVWGEEIIVDTSKAWEFEFRCSIYCWAGHQDMVWKIIIE